MEAVEQAAEAAEHAQPDGGRVRCTAEDDICMRMLRRLRLHGVATNPLRARDTCSAPLRTSTRIVCQRPSFCPAAA